MIQSVEQLEAEIVKLRAELEGYKQWAEDHKRLVRHVDVIINGEEGAAPQASLCDIVSQIETDWPELKAERDALRDELQQELAERIKLAKVVNQLERKLEVRYD